MTLKNMDIKLQAIMDLFMTILKREEVECNMFMLNDELNAILDIEKNDIEERVKKIDEIIIKINESIHTSTAEKKQFGEVFTSLTLVNEMLDTLPKSVWSNPNLKWLDPANGYGNFPVVVVQRLMEGLKTWEPDAEKRYKHIMENMIYVCDINLKNMFIYRKLFNLDGKLNLNAFRGSFLDRKFDDKMKEWVVEKFDIIMGNPPYQEIDKNNKSKSGGNSLWSKFISQSINILVENGYLCFITPSSWMSPGANTSKNVDTKINNYDLLHLEIETAKKYFDVGSNFTWYLLRKSVTKDLKTIIKTLNKNILFESEIDLKCYTYLPLFLCDKVLSIKDKFVSKTYFNFIIDFSFDHRKDFINEIEDENHKFPLIHTSKQKRYSKKPHPVQFDDKIIITRSGNISPFFDNGVFGTTDVSLYFLTKNEKYVDLLNSKLYKFYLNTFKWSGFHNPDILNTLPIIDIDDATDENIYKHFNLTQEEIDLIEETIKEKPAKISKSVGANIATSSYDFKVGETYNYTGTSKKIQKGQVEIVKILKNSFRVKDLNGNEADVNVKTLEF
jgi:site-specific DNA-methyltransferase (adenine-specific)